MEIMKFLCLSTVHIDPETAKWLDGEPSTVWLTVPTVHDLPFTVWKSEYGYFLSVEILDYRDSDIRVPADLLACLRKASEAGCEWLRLDGDGPAIEGLADYEQAWAA